MASTGYSKNSTTANLTLALAAVSASAAIFVATYIWRRKWGDVQSKIRELEKSLNSALEKYTAERQGRVRAQQALRKALAQPKSANSGSTSYPMRPIGVVQSCFSTRNGTPRQPLLVPLARACLIFDPTMVPPASLEGLEEYSHCWIVYVFHLNTDLEKLWKPPSNSKFKAKVRVPRLNGGRMGVFATRSPHRPCPIGLTVAKVEAVLGQMVLLSGVDLVDGTPVLDIKPYLPYCDSIRGATVPSWVTIDNMLAVASVSFSECFTSSLADCWKKVEKKSLYASPHELKSLVEQVLSWDIRSISQRNRPHNAPMKVGNVNGNTLDNSSDFDDNPDEEAPGNKSSSACPSRDIIYHLILEGMDVSYRIDCNGNIIVETIVVSPKIQNGTRSHSSYHTWSKKLG